MGAFDTSMYQQNPLRSVADYEGDYQKQAMAKQVLQQNALALQTGQMGLQDRQRAIEEQGVVRNALAQLGPNAGDPDRINALKRTGTQTGFAAADALEKALLERESKKALTNKTEVETKGLTLTQEIKAIEFNLQKLSSVRTPQQYAAWLDGGVKSGLMPKEQAMLEMSQIPADPAKLMALIEQQQAAAVDVKERLTLQAIAARDAETAANNLRVDSRVKSEGAANRGVQLRGQNIARDAALQGGGVQVDGQGNMVVVPNKFTPGTPVQSSPVIGADGKPLKGKEAGGGQPTEDERKAAGYAIRMEGALKKLEEVGAQNPEALKPGVGTSLINMTPEGVANYMRSAPRQRIETAQVDALDAALTLATGAAYTKEQLKGLSRSYFTQPGDDATTIKDKEQRLAEVIETARIRAGRAAPSIEKMGAARTPAQPAADGYSDAEKERRYQEFAAREAAKGKK